MEDNSYYIDKRRELMEIELISNIQLTFTISSFSCCHAFEQVNRGKRKRRRLWKDRNGVVALCSCSAYN